MTLSIIIAARNAEATLADAVESLLSQSLGDWEAVIVNNGSTDATPAIAAAFAARDPRIRLLTGDFGSAAAARNAGLRATARPWLLFLYADDWLYPAMIAQMLPPLAADPWADVAHCGWTFAAPDRRPLMAMRRNEAGDLSELVAREWVFPLNCCIVRRSLVERFGGFDENLHAAEIFDFWQKAAFSGARFKWIDGHFAQCRLRPDAERFRLDLLMPEMFEVHRRGRAVAESEDAEVQATGWAIAIAVASGQPLDPVIGQLAPIPAGSVDAGRLAALLHVAIPLHLLRPIEDWSAIWRERHPAIRDALALLADHLGDAAFADRVMRPLERRIGAGRHAVATLEITAPFADIRIADAERLSLRLLCEGAPLGEIELPLFDGRVPAPVIADAIAASHYWDLLGRFFARRLFPQLAVEREGEGWSIARGSCRLGSIAGEVAPDDDQLHRTVGWTLLVQELTGLPDWTIERLYDNRESPPAPARLCSGGVERIDLADPLPELVGPGEVVEIEALIGGAELLRTRLSAPGGRITAGQLRVALLDRARTDLARVAVREAILGRPLDDRTPLRERVADNVAPPRSCHLPAALAPLILENRDPGPSVSPYSRQFFDNTFAARPNPWRYDTPYEQTKYAQTWSLLSGRRAQRALEIGCAEGHFTAWLASAAETLVAADISEIALERAAERCAGFSNIEYRQLDLAADPLPGGFDLIVCSEMLYYVGDAERLAEVARKIADALAPGGRLVMAHASLAVDDGSETGFDWQFPFGAKAIGRIFAAVPGLRFARELRSPLYRIQLFEKPRLALPWRMSPRVAQVRHAEPEPHVARHILWSGGHVAPAEPRTAETSALPILMYHRVAPDGPAPLARWRVTPEQFEAQMRHLRAAGFTPTTLEDWHIARRTSAPLAGRRVIITFDDGYRDFARHALPALRDHGFPAIIFLPTDLVGTAATWDAWAGEPAPLMDWEMARQLQQQGMAFGSHGARHRRMTDLSPSEMAEEALHSRLTLARELGLKADAIAYPFGASDTVVEQVVAACGYSHGLTTRDALSSPHDRPFDLARIEVRGDMTLEDFAASLSGR